MVELGFFIWYLFGVLYWIHKIRKTEDIYFRDIIPILVVGLAGLILPIALYICNHEDKILFKKKVK